MVKKRISALRLFTSTHMHKYSSHIQFFHLKQVAVGPYGYQWKVGKDFNDSSVPHLNLRIDRRTYGDVDPTTRTYNVSSEQVTGNHNNFFVDNNLIVIAPI